MNTPPSIAILNDHDVHAWWASVQAQLENVASLRNTLSPEELRRAERFHHQRDCDRYIIARGLSRVMLASNVGREPSQLCFGQEKFGKPFLLRSRNEPPLHFNLSHSHDQLVCAITQRQRIGTDVEYIRAISEEEQIVEQLFSEQEKSTYFSAASICRRDTFFRLWTRKEAVLKARGTGLAEANCSFTSRQLSDCAYIYEDSIARDSWTVMTLTTRTGYAGAVAIEGQDFVISCTQWGYQAGDRVDTRRAAGCSISDPRCRS